jgi:hypothetical protein
MTHPLAHVVLGMHQQQVRPGERLVDSDVHLPHHLHGGKKWAPMAIMTHTERPATHELSPIVPHSEQPALSLTCHRHCTDLPLRTGS